MKKKPSNTAQPTLFDLDLEAKDVPRQLVHEAPRTLESLTSRDPSAESSGESSPNSLRESEPSAATSAIDSSGAANLSKPLAPEDLVILVDSHSLIYQVFHAMPSMTGPTGLEVNAVHGFLRDLADLRDRWQPSYLICAFDESEITFRNELYPQYKAQRDPMPEALRAQIPLIHQAIEALNFVKLSVPGFEADDILATLAHQVEAAGAKCLLVTSDKDCRQLLSDRVGMLNIRKSEIFDVEALKLSWNVTPEQVVDFQSLVGDSVDNVPGVPQIGPKAAQQLLEQFGSLENLYANLDQVTAAKRQETLRQHRDAAFLSQSLVRLRRDVPIEIDWATSRLNTVWNSKTEAIFRDFGFRRLADRFQTTNRNASQKECTASELSRKRYRRIVPDSCPATVASETTADSILITVAVDRPIRQRWSDFVGELRTHFSQVRIDERWLAIDTETTSLAARDAEVVGVSLAWQPGEAAYLPLLGPQADELLPQDAVWTFLRELFEDGTIAKIGQNLKYDLIVLRGQGLSVQGIVMDTMVADYLLEPGGRNHNLDELAKRHLGHTNISIEQLIGSGREQRSMATVDLDLIASYAAEDVDVPFRLNPILRQSLINAKLDQVLDRIEIPLIEVLTEMEFNGIRVDCDRLQELSDTFEKRISELKSEILSLAGVPFNPDSPKQLAQVLFERLGLRVVKKTKTGPSTDAEVLQELAMEHPLPAKIVDYRQATKLKSTYIDALPMMVSRRTGRIHTSFRQDVAATGRLSSSDPNLQNIPIRTDEGRAIRSAFQPGEPHWSLLTADYSQIELRVLAHYCGDESLKDAFANNEDIHARVAAEVHGVEIGSVTSAMRRGAKAVNFGILYGQSPFGLAKALSITKAEASDFIDRYFDRYRSVRDFMRQTLDRCRRDGYVTTISGRKRFLKGIRDFSLLNPQQQKSLLEPERMAINTVIQGSAADMIKIAMIRIYQRLRSSPLRARMLLQIHDELVFEVIDDDLRELSELVRDEMVSAVPLDVPIVVDLKSGCNWADCQPLS